MAISQHVWYKGRNVYLDRDGQAWHIEYEGLRDVYLACNPVTGERMELDARTLDQRFPCPQALPWRYPSKAKRDLQEIGRKRMVRIRAKVQIRREALLRTVAWWLGWVWGGMAAVAVTIVLLKLLTRQILG